MNKKRPTCQVEECVSLVAGKKQYCKKHQTRFERHGDPTFSKRGPSIQVGEKFGRLTVVRLDGSDNQGNSLFYCSCLCGGSTVTRSFTLRSGKSNSCGCLRLEKISQKKKRIEVAVKRCSTCKMIKDISEFGKKKTAVDGHKSQCRDCGRLWHKNNPDKVSETNRYRRRKIDKATPTWVNREEFRVIEKDRIEIQEKTGMSYEIDHIIPIKHESVCGLHVPWNLEIVTSNYNNSKGNRASQQFLDDNGFGVRRLERVNSEFVDSFPALNKLWDSERNSPLTPKVVHITCPILVWWKCPKGHSWTKSVTLIQKNSVCPVCAGVSEEGFDNSFIAENIAKEWDYEKNAPWNPQDYGRHSNKTVYWLCENGHSYRKQISARSSGVGCPVCRTQGLRIMRNSRAADTAVYSFQHKNGEKYTGTRSEFASQYDLSGTEIRNLISRKKYSYRGWFLEGEDPRKMLKQVSLVHKVHGEIVGSIPEISENYGLDKDRLYALISPSSGTSSYKGWMVKGLEKAERVIKLRHAEYGEFVGTPIAIISKYPNLTSVGISNVVNKKQLFHQGWSLEGTERPLKVYEFIHADHGRFKGAMVDLKRKYPDLDSGGLSKLCAGKNSSYKGWILVEKKRS